jgi:hypothetical protein
VNIPGIGSVLRIVPVALALGACAPEFVDEVAAPPAASVASGGGITQAELPPGPDVATSPKSLEVVDPPPVPDPGADLAPSVPPPVTTTPVTRIPPRPPIWQAPPSNYNANRPDAAPLGIPNRPPAAWRY